MAGRKGSKYHDIFLYHQLQLVTSEGLDLAEAFNIMKHEIDSVSHEIAEDFFNRINKISGRK
jgi:hypothetical protein